MIKLSTYIAIGVANPSNYEIEGGKELGLQANSFNCSYVWDNIGSHKIYNNEGEKKQVQSLHEGSLLDIFVDFDSNQVHFWHNDKYQGFTSAKQKLEEGQLYPASCFRQLLQ